VKLGVVADVHGNHRALRAVLADADRFGVDRWWALGDLVLFGPRPVEVLELLRGLPGIEMLRGNTDRYVLTGEQPAPHATVADAARSIDLVERYAAMAAHIGWTRGVLDQAGLLGVLDGLPAQLRLRLPGGTAVLGVHASPGADDNPGIAPGVSEEQLGRLLAGCGADVVIGGHTHYAVDRVVDGIRARNSLPPSSLAHASCDGRRLRSYSRAQDLPVDHVRAVPARSGAGRAGWRGSPASPAPART
jgi:predicted phosphodiesterase